MDAVGVLLLPGTYDFTARLYRYEYRESVRIGTVDLHQGEAGFPVEQPVLEKVLAEKPYMEVINVPLTLKAGFNYGIWCTADGKIELEGKENGN